MFNPTAIVIDAFVGRLRDSYIETYGTLHPEYPGILGFVGRIALENIANTDAPYHDVFHTILVTDVGLEILRGRHIQRGGVGPRDWVHFVVSLLCHDIGYVRGVCRGDGGGRWVVSEDGETIATPPGATDAAMTPHHVARSKLFVEQRFGAVDAIDTEVVKANIEYTRFPVPTEDAFRDTADYPALLRAADLIGQMADIAYLRKCAALFQEFRETGAAVTLGYTNADDLRHAYPKFFWRSVRPVIGDALGYLNVTQDGKMWTNNLYANVFIEEHGAEMAG